MTHLTNDINQLEAVLRNVRREQQTAVNDLREAQQALIIAQNARDTAKEQSIRLADLIDDLSEALSILKNLNSDPPGGGGGGNQ